MKIRRLLYGLAVLLVLTASGIGAQAFALEAGGYVVTNTTYYVNPDTGVSDDGGDTSTGEGMCRNAVYTDSFYEFEDGKHYVTIRLKLISFIKNIAFQVQQVKGDSNSYQEVGYTVKGENRDENTKDFRLELPAADALVKPSFFVGPMKRDVIFFMRINPDTVRKDDGSFAAFNKTNAEEPPEPAQTGGQNNTASPLGNDQSAGETTVDGKETAAAAPVPAGGDEPASVTEGQTPSEETEEVTGIIEYPAKGEAEAEESGAGFSPAAAGTVVAILCLAGGGVLIWKKNKQKQQ